MKIGILLCDHVQTHLQTAHGDYPEMFLAAFDKLNVKSNVDSKTSLSFYHVIDGQLPRDIDECDAYISSGSKFSVNDNFPWIHQLADFINLLYQGKKVFIGICFGHQLMAKVLGGKVQLNPKGWGVGISKASITCQMHWMQPQLNAIKLLVSHQEIVTVLPKKALLLAGNDFCPHAMYQVDSHFLGIQAHPEFTFEYAKDLMLSRKGSIAEENLSQGLDSLAMKSDSDIVMAWLKHFIKQGLT